MWTTFKATVRTLLLTPSAVIWTLIFPIVLATVFNFMFEPMRSTGSVEAVKVAVVADDAWEDSPFSQIVDTLSEADEPLLAVHPVAGEDEARVLLAAGARAGGAVETPRESRPPRPPPAARAHPASSSPLPGPARAATPPTTSTAPSSNRSRPAICNAWRSSKTSPRMTPRR